MMRATLLALMMLTATAAGAQQVYDQATAKRLLFSSRGAQLAIVQEPFLSDADIATLRELPGIAELKYYGALAVDPAQGLQSQATRGAFSFHSVEAARAAAIAACGRTCRIVAEIRPRGYEEGRALTLNQDASRTIEGRDFGRAGADAALAASPSTGAWGLGSDGEVAIATCAAEGAADCTVAVAD